MSEASGPRQGSNERICYNKGCGKRFKDKDNDDCEFLLFLLSCVSLFVREPLVFNPGTGTHHAMSSWCALFYISAESK